VTRAAAALSLGLSLACSSGREVAERRSAAQVARAVEVLRNAPNPAKAQALLGLRQVSCQGVEVCATHAACMAGYALHVEALALTQAAKQQLADGKSAEAARVLGSAEQKLVEADAQVTACTDLEAKLRRQHGL
jgi:hypothetical protein